MKKKNLSTVIALIIVAAIVVIAVMINQPAPQNGAETAMPPQTTNGSAAE